MNFVNTSIIFCILSTFTSTSYSEDIRVEKNEATAATGQEAKGSNNARDIFFPFRKSEEKKTVPAAAKEKPLLLNVDEVLNQCKIPKLLKCLSIKEASCHTLITATVLEANSAAEQIASKLELTKEDLQSTSTTKFMVYMSLKTENKYLTCLAAL